MKKVLLSLAIAMLAALLLAPEAAGDNRVRRVKRQQQTNQREVRETKRKLTAKDPAIGKAWYIPGYGRYDDRIGGTFNVIIEL